MSIETNPLRLFGFGFGFDSRRFNRPPTPGARGRKSAAQHPHHGDTHAREIRQIHERIVLDPQKLFDDNCSELSQRRREKFFSEYDKGRIVIACVCCDSRILQLLSNGSTLIDPQIAAGGEKNVDMHKNGYSFGMIATHILCGGQRAKQNEVSGLKNKQGKRITGYVKEQILHWDPVINSQLQAQRASQRNRDRVWVAATIDETKAELIPYAAYRNGGLFLQAAELDSNSYIPGASRVPRFTDEQLSQLPEDIRKYFDLQRDFAAHFRATRKDLKEIQLAQNPLALILDMPKANPPLSARYPKTFGEPGTGFRIHNRAMDRNQARANFAQVLAQAEYAVDSFTRMSTVICETGSRSLSREFAYRFANSDVGRRWRDKYGDDGKILIAVSERGRLKSVPEVFNP